MTSEVYFYTKNFDDKVEQGLRYGW